MPGEVLRGRADQLLHSATYQCARDPVYPNWSFDGRIEGVSRFGSWCFDTKMHAFVASV